MRKNADFKAEQIDELLGIGWEMKEYKMNGLQANIRGLLCAVPFLLFVGGMYRVFLQERAVLWDDFFLPFVLIIVVCVVLHEMLHGLGWQIAGHVGWSAVSFAFKHGMPLCSCKKLLTTRQYMTGLLFPFFVLGGVSIIFLIIYPGTLSILTAFVNFCLPGGDLVIALIMLRSGAAMAADIPDQAGFVGVIPSQQT